MMSTTWFHLAASTSHVCAQPTGTQQALLYFKGYPRFIFFAIGIDRLEFEGPSVEYS